MKRLACSIVGWLAEWFPEAFFFSSRFMDGEQWALSEGESDDPHTTYATTCILGVAVSAARSGLEVGGKYTANFTSVTDGGREIGNYRVIVERLPG